MVLVADVGGEGVAAEEELGVESVLHGLEQRVLADGADEVLRVFGEVGCGVDVHGGWGVWWGVGVRWG